MESLSPALVHEVRCSLRGARQAKFDASVKAINDSLAQGGWIPRGSVKANAGFYQGLAGRYRDHKAGFEFSMCFSYGHARFTEAELEAVLPQLDPLEAAWARLCIEKRMAVQELDVARPPPKVTAIGLSAKVTKTLKEMNLDIDLPTIKMAKINFWLRPLFNKDGSPSMGYDGKQRTERVYYVEWTPGIKHNMSRFNGGGHCEACGKHIPSCRFVPVEATCKRNGLVSMWLGCDCAASIFGIKDQGINPADAPK